MRHPGRARTCRGSSVPCRRDSGERQPRCEARARRASHSNGVPGTRPERRRERRRLVLRREAAGGPQGPVGLRRDGARVRVRRRREALPVQTARRAVLQTGPSRCSLPTGNGRSCCRTASVGITSSRRRTSGPTSKAPCRPTRSSRRSSRRAWLRSSARTGAGSRTPSSSTRWAAKR